MSDRSQIVASLRRLSQRDAVVGVVAFGSLARHELTGSSDVDVLVVHDASANLRHLREAVDQIASSENIINPLVPIFFTPQALVEEIDQHPSFGAHLADESIVVYSSPPFKKVEERLRSLDISREDLHDELSKRLRQLRLFSDLARFNGEFAPCLAQLYSIGRSVVIVKLLERNIREYGWQRIFSTYANVKPELRNNLNRIESLRAYYEHIHNRSELPESRLSVDPDYVTTAIDSITTVAKG